MTTFARLLDSELRRDGGRPLVTWYDERSGERVELSVTTYANWVAKTASLLVEEHDLGRGDTLLVDLPSHWLGPVFLGAAWTAGLVVAFPAAVADLDADAVVCGPGSVSGWAGRAAELPVLACSLRPMGARFADPLPSGVHDVGTDVWSQPDAFVAFDPPGPEDVALLTAEGPVTQAELWSAAAAGSRVTGGGRLITEANPASPPGIATIVEPLRSGGSLVLVVHADAARFEAIAAAERAQPARS